MLIQYYTFREACAALKVSPNTLRAMLRRGEITGRKIGGQWRFTEDELAKPAQRQDNISVTPTVIPIVSTRHTKAHTQRPNGLSVRERLKADGYI